MRRWRLGLDVGTASVGAVAIELDAAGKEIGVPWHHVRIFSEPNEKGKTGLTPKKAGRREARQQRRQLERRARRIRKIAHLIPLLGLDPKSIPPHGRTGQQLPLIRAKAARERIELADFVRVLLRIAKKRGYAGGFRATKDDKELGVVHSGSGALKQKMDELAQQLGCPSVTVGEYLADRTVKGLPTRLKISRDDVADLYALRSMIESEFDQIWSLQEQFHIELRAEYGGRPVREVFREVIFRQRPLKSPAAAVGLCPLEIFLPRSPRAQMAAQDFRIEKTLADLRWGAGRLAQDLSIEQRVVVRQVLNTPESLTKDGKISFKRIYKLLEAAGCSGPPGCSLNIDRASRDELIGNKTLKVFALLGLGSEWQSLEGRSQTSVINLLADLGSPQQLDPDDWHERFLKSNARPNDKAPFRVFSPEVISFVNQLRDCDGYDRLTKMGFEGGRMGYSVKALARLTAWLKDPSWRDAPSPSARVDEDAAVSECYPDKARNRVGGRQLSPSPKTGNDTVDVALAQVHWTVQDALQAMGSPPTEIIVEFGRDVGLGPAKRNEWEKLSDKNQRLRNNAKREIEESGASGTNTAIRRYQLWEEQGTHCPYCNQSLCLGDVLDGSQSHIEHIIPRSLTRVGRKRSEIVIAHAACNNLKGDRTPYQAFGHDPQRWTLIEERAEALKKAKQYRKAKLLLLKDFEQEVMNDQSIADFVDRQLHQTSWIARSASQWLHQLCPNVFAARGEFTAMLRRSWHLDTVIPEVRLDNGLAVLDTDGKPVSAAEFEQYRQNWENHGRAPSRILEKRLDHRHHAVDALVIGLASRSLYQKLASNYKKSLSDLSSGQKHRREWQVEPPLKDIRAIATKLVSQCQLTHKPDRFSAGNFYQATAYALHHDENSDSVALKSRGALSDLLDEKSLEKTRKKIAYIASPEVRDLVMAEFDRRITAGETPKQALSRPVAYPRYGTVIRRVRVLRTDVSADKAIEIQFQSRQGGHRKLLLPDGNAYLEIYGAGKSAKTRVVSIAESGITDESPGRTRRFYKGDTVIDRKDGVKLVVRQIIATGKGQLILTPLFETRPVVGLKAIDGLRKPTGGSLDRLVLANVLSPSAPAGGSSLPRN